MSDSRAQPSLFDPLPGACPHCQATSRDRCDRDRQVREGYARATDRRPKGCLASPDPARDPFPQGF
jgi:hypothetical protein